MLLHWIHDGTLAFDPFDEFFIQHRSEASKAHKQVPISFSWNEEYFVKTQSELQDVPLFLRATATRVTPNIISTLRHPLNLTLGVDFRNRPNDFHLSLYS